MKCISCTSLCMYLSLNGCIAALSISDSLYNAYLGSTLYKQLRVSVLHHLLDVLSHVTLKMLGLYLYTLKIGHKSRKMLSMLNNLTLQKDGQTFVTNNVFMDKK